MLGLLLTLTWPAVATAGCDDPFVDPDDVLTFTLTTDSATWDALTFDSIGGGCDEQYPFHAVEFRCGSEAPLTIAARHKRGDQRGRDTDFKPPLKLDFNHEVPGQRWPASYGDLGFKKLSLNNGQEDNPGGVLTALLSEHLAWRLMQREVPAASGVAYARLYVELTDVAETNYHGLYILLEDIDRTALKRRWGDDADGELLKTTTGSCRDQIVFSDPVAANLATMAFDAWMALDDADFVGTWSAETDTHLWLDELLRAEALRDVLANGADTVLGPNYSNFYSWDESDVARRHYLPWDLDDVFRPYPQDVPFTTSLETGCSEIGQRTRCQDEIEVQYLETACQLINGTLDPDRLIGDWDAVDALIRPIIPDETEPVWGGDDPLEPDRDDNYQAEYERIRTWIADRIPEVRSQIEARGVACPAGCPAGAVEACEWRDCAGERRCGSDGLWTGCELIDVEIGGNGLDDDCDALIDEDDVTGTTPPTTSSGPTTPPTDTGSPPGTDPAPADPGVAGGEEAGGCGCTGLPTTGRGPAGWLRALARR